MRSFDGGEPIGSGSPVESAHAPANPQEIDEMSTAYEWPQDMAQASHSGIEGNWMEATIRSVTESVEDYAHREPLKFAAWVFGIGFVLGWKMKLW
jgi:hypothetical protein